MKEKKIEVEVIVIQKKIGEEEVGVQIEIGEEEVEAETGVEAKVEKEGKMKSNKGIKEISLIIVILEEILI